MNEIWRAYFRGGGGGGAYYLNLTLPFLDVVYNFQSKSYVDQV